MDVQKSLLVHSHHTRTARTRTVRTRTARTRTTQRPQHTAPAARTPSCTSRPHPHALSPPRPLTPAPSVQACGLGLADAVVDLVETGTTMRAAGLCILETLMTTEAVLISNPHCKHPDLAQKIIARIQGYIDSTKFQLINYNCPRAKLPECLAITPGKKSPSLLPLERGDWVAVQAMIAKKEVADIIDRLINSGAEDILVFALSNCRV